MANHASLERLKAEVARTNITQVAAKMGVPRCTLSLVVRDKYPANPKNILDKFEDAFGRILCPHLNIELKRSECLDYSSKPRPSNPIGLAHWRACRNCEHGKQGDLK
jgi:hypothetical protein